MALGRQIFLPSLHLQSCNLLLTLLLLLGEIGGTRGVRNCLLARQLCDDDPACRSILEIIPRLCGPEKVSCSTVTVNKCLAALRTIQGFPYFQPTCLCREPHLDRECNIFREFIFDHPCSFVLKKKNEEQYAVHALPTCEYSLRTCEQLPGCLNLYDEFRQSCRVKDEQCRMDNSEACLVAWTNLKTSPMFGCICPGDYQRKKCTKIFIMVHQNPCVDSLPASSAPPKPGQRGVGVWGIILPPPPPVYPTVRTPHYPHHLHPQVPWASYPHPHVPLLTVAPMPSYSAQTQNVLSIVRPSPRPFGNIPDSFPVSVIPYENTSLHAGHKQFRNPLLEAAPSGGAGIRQNTSRVADVLGGGHHHPQRLQPVDSHASSVSPASSPLPLLHSTCQTALVGCSADASCRRLLNPVLSTCDDSSCNREACMENLKTFYRNVGLKWSLEVAFCLCRKSSSTADECLVAQEKLHPSCARRPAGPAPMLCNRLAQSCKNEKSCRHRLEFYEQACAVDSDTQRCAGSMDECRRALLGILGTHLRSICTCAASDPRETFICMDWQRILWFNPCVVESQTDYHREMLYALGPNLEYTTSPSIVFTTSVTTGVISEPIQQGNGVRHSQTTTPGVIDSTFNSNANNNHPQPQPIPTTTTTTTTTLPPKFCVKNQQNGVRDYIVEGGGRRYYKVADPSCSELCNCYSGEELVCNVLDCVEAKSCRTNYAVYNHRAPAYQARRGECVCYSGTFICVRPPNDTYSAGEGVFLFMGYSKAEENLLRRYTKLSIRDTVPRLEKLLKETAVDMDGPDCHLEIMSHFGENMILQATLEEFEDLRENISALMLNKEKDTCAASLKAVSKLINNQDPLVHSDLALSMLIISEVQLNVPPMPASASPLSFSVVSTIFFALIASTHFVPGS